MLEDGEDDGGLGREGQDAQAPVAATAGEDIDLVNATEEVGPRKAAGTHGGHGGHGGHGVRVLVEGQAAWGLRLRQGRRRRAASPARAGQCTPATGARGEGAMVADQVSAGRRHQCREPAGPELRRRPQIPLRGRPGVGITSPLSVTEMGLSRFAPPGP